MNRQIHTDAGKRTDEDEDDTVPRRIDRKNLKARPEQMLEKIMVFRWLRREEINPDAIKVVKYPIEINKNREPASALLKVRSDLTLGMRGAKTMRDMKFTKKMEVRSNSGGSRARNVSPASGSWWSMFER